MKLKHNRKKHIYYLRKTTLVIKDSKYPMGLCCYDVNTVLVVAERDLLPVNLLSAVFLLGENYSEKNMTFMLTMSDICIRYPSSKKITIRRVGLLVLP